MPEEQSIVREHRDPTLERQERDAFLVLFHIFNVSAGDPDVELAADQVARDLAFEMRDASLLIDHLVMCGHVRCRIEGGLCITPFGKDYIDHEAGRRRSVRSRIGHPAGLQKWSGAQREIA
jgi:hypothetical protein